MSKKRKISFLIIILFILLAILLTLYVSGNIVKIKNSIERSIYRFGYFGIFISSLLLDLLEQPIGPDLPISIGVIFGLNIFYILFFAILGSTISSVANFYIGKRFLSSRVKDACDIYSHKKYCEFFSRKGKLAIFLAAISPLPWVAFCWISGSFKMKFRHFLIYGLIPRFVRFYGVAILVWYFYNYLAIYMLIAKVY